MSATAQHLEAELEAMLRAPSLRRLALVTALVLLLGVGGMTTWAAVTPLERAVIAGGALVTEGRRKTITLLEAGILHELVVREGETVRAGQALLRLDVTQAEAAANQARVQYWAQAARTARLRAEQEGLREMRLPPNAEAEAASDPGLAALLAAEPLLLAARWAAYDGAIALQRTRIAQLHEHTQALAAQRVAMTTRLRATREELAGVNQLLARGYATRTRAWELQRNEAELLGNLGQYQAQEAQAREQIGQTELEMANVTLARQQDVARQLQDARAQLADAAERLRSARDVLQRREVLAPETGTVTDIRFFTRGSSIAAAQPVLDIVPLDDRLVAEARVATGDIEQVHVGQRANVRLSAYRSRELPPLPGRVIYVSADRQDDGRGNEFFLVRVELDPDALAQAGGPTLAAGMPTEVFLLGEQRTALDYLIRPLRDSLRRSLRD